MIGIFKKKREPKVINRFEVGWKATNNIQAMELLMKEASTRVDDTVKDHHEITKRAFSILLVVLSITSVLCGFLISQLANENRDKILVAITIVGFICCIFLTFYLVNLIRPKKFRAPGREPRKAMVNELFKNDKLQGDDLYKALLYKELVHAQVQIDLNQHSNTIRYEKIDFVLRFVSIVSILLILLTFILELI